MDDQPKTANTDRVLDAIAQQLEGANVRFVRDFAVPATKRRADFVIFEPPIVPLLVRRGAESIDEKELLSLRRAFGPAGLFIATDAALPANLAEDGLVRRFEIKRWPGEGGGGERDVKRMAERFLVEPLRLIRDRAQWKKAPLMPVMMLEDSVFELVPLGPESVRLTDVDATTAQIRVLFGELLDESSRHVLDHELRELESEFHDGHYTSCALRVGRCLELVVYALAQDWGVPIDERPLLAMSRLESKLQAVNEKIAAYSATTEAGAAAVRARQRARTELLAAVTGMSQELIQVVGLLDEPAPVDDRPWATSTTSSPRRQLDLPIVLLG